MSTPYRQLRRPRRGRMLSGVCAALADFTGISAFWFRLGFLLALLPGGIPGLLLYLLGWLLIPGE
ncbi:MAG: PspC domain-containing protein [Chloroflexi bacterium]|nr:PspC domain-containing protein [Chloroflexota bacterium]